MMSMQCENETEKKKTGMDWQKLDGVYHNGNEEAATINNICVIYIYIRLG